MTTSINSFGEEYTKWESHKHPDNPNYMQTVYWKVWVKDGKTTVCYSLGSGSKPKFLYNMTKDEAIEKFTDKEVAELTDGDYEKWLSKK